VWPSASLRLAFPRGETFSVDVEAGGVGTAAGVVQGLRDEIEAKSASDRDALMASTNATLSDIQTAAAVPP